MTKGTKIFRSIISVLLALCFLLIVFLFFAVYYFDQVIINQDDYGISVAGVKVTRENEDDILGDGTVFYDSVNNRLVFGYSEIRTDEPIIAAEGDIGICLIGENKFISTSTESMVLIYAAEYYLDNDIYIYGDGSLSVEYTNSIPDSSVIQCANLTILSDITITTPECENISNGIVCDSSLKLLDGATVTVNGSPAEYLAAIRVRGNMLLEAGTALNVTVGKGSDEVARGINVSGDLIIGDGSTVSVTTEEDEAKVVECIRVNGLLEVGYGSVVSATSAKSYAIECYGSMKLCGDAVINATSENLDVDVICYGAAVNYGATVNGKIEALGRIYDK